MLNARILPTLKFICNLKVWPISGRVCCQLQAYSPRHPKQVAWILLIGVIYFCVKDSRFSPSTDTGTKVFCFKGNFFKPSRFISILIWNLIPCVMFTMALITQYPKCWLCTVQHAMDSLDLFWLNSFHLLNNTNLGKEKGARVQVHMTWSLQHKKTWGLYICLCHMCMCMYVCSHTFPTALEIGLEKCLLCRP